MFLFTLLSNLGVALAGIFLGWFLLRGMDISNDISFKYDVMADLKTGNMATAIYYGARIVAIYAFIGACLARVPI